jgi:hypothetical protein
MRGAATALFAVAILATVRADQDPPLDLVLARAAEYVDTYQKRLAAIVAEEQYRQQVISSSRPGRISGRQYRELRSDVLLVKPGEGDSWLQFRDVFEVDRKPVRDRDQRLYKLFVEAKADREAQAQTIQQESARYNIGPLHRTVNIPIMGMLFFDRPNQAQSAFKRVESGNVKALAALAAPADIWTVEFKETQPGTLVRGAWGRDVPSHGRAWIDHTTGRILRTEQISADTFVRGEIDVTYRTETGLDVLVPGEMRENYIVVQQNTVINGHATYTRFRRFIVTTTEKPKQQ